MKRIFYSLVFAPLIILLGFNNKQTDKQTGGNDLPHIAIAGIAIESGTFSPALTIEEAFHARTGDAIFKDYPFLSSDSLNRQRANWIP